MPRGVVVKPGRFNRQPQNYLALLIRRQKADDDHGKWEPVSRWGYTVLCPNEYELHEFARWLGPRVGFPSPWGVVDDDYDDWLFANAFRKMQYGRPRGQREMMWGELVSGWIPSEEQLLSGRSSPMITDAHMERRPGPPTMDESLRDAIAASMPL